MRLQLLAMSDTHLGEDSSLLSYPHGLQRLWDVLRIQLGGGERFEVDKLVLVGDIPDRCLSSTSQIISCTNAFMDTMVSAAHINKVVYVPGNHDHTIWSEYCQSRHARPSGITGPGGDDLLKGGRPVQQNEGSLRLLTLFFGYPAGGTWNRVEREGGPDFSIANPIYATAVDTSQGQRTYVFSHGTHFRPEVADPQTRSWMSKLRVLFRLAEIDPRPCCDLDSAQSLEDLEEKVSPFVDSLWVSSRNNPINQSDQFWYKINTLRKSMGEGLHSVRPDPIQSQLFHWPDLPKQKSISQLSPQDGSLMRFQRVFLGHMMRYLEQGGVASPDTTFVYGDTHNGGWGSMADRSMRVYNCGCWVTHDAHNHPPCHVFAVKEDGTEVLLDVSFHGVNVEGDPILALAASESEHNAGKGVLGQIRERLGF